MRKNERKKIEGEGEEEEKWPRREEKRTSFM
jgi:hypothetical protein